MARTAVVAGTATAVSNRVSRRQAGRWAQQEEAYPPQAYQQPVSAPPPAPAPEEDDMEAKLAQLRQLGELKDSGVLSEAEFAEQKRRVLQG